MYRVYHLSLIKVDGADTIAGAEFIHDAIIYTTPDPDIRELLMNTTPDEDQSLTALALGVRDATQEEIDTLDVENATTSPPSQDTLRAQELLESSPDAITQPEIWELLRIIGRRLGYRFD